MAFAHLGFHENMEEIEAALNVDPDNPDTLFRRAEAFRHQRLWDKALQDYDQALALSNEFHAVYLGRARVQLNRGDPVAAQRSLNQYTAHRPTEWQGQTLQAEIHVSKSNFWAAAESFKTVIAHHPRLEPGHYLNLARTLQKAGITNTTQALSFLEEGELKLGPLPVLLLERAEIAQNGNQPSAALSAMNDVIERYGTNPNWLLRRGELLLELDRKAEAQETFLAVRRAIHKLPTRRRDSVAHKLLINQVNYHLETLRP